ncbi:hypothetical protein [Sulfurospirillum arcachonense]|uniref:hypothetical protein n=1 Tax=Sulfurospirillum arcachonense TaxID=57666 RepID=UPI0004697EBE|nr:hypothetical protein [Sulfurospirillum arcachonense]
MKKVDLSLVDESFLNNYISSINIENIKLKLKELSLDYIADNLESIIKSDIDKIEMRYRNLLAGKSKEDLKEIENIFNYTGHRAKEKFIKNFSKLGIKSCPFCNNNYVYFYKKNSEEYDDTVATLEHYYPKAKYPHLSLSFYNLIPSCYICNSKFRGKASYVGNILHPYKDDFHKRATFSLHVDGLPVSKDIELKVKLKSNEKDDTKCETTIKRFHLDKIYEEHEDIAKEIWNKTQVYNEDRIKELYNSFYKELGYSKEDVENFVFSNYLEEKDINKRNHSKLTQDIKKQLKNFHK